MQKLGWNEIRVRAAKFAQEWDGKHYEKSGTQTFYNQFFEIFGVSRQSVARFEERVRKLDNRYGFIDLFWPGKLIVEQKSTGANLQKAVRQAGEYFDAIPEHEKPRYQLICDFQTFELLDRAERNRSTFQLRSLHEHVEKFAFIIGKEPRSWDEHDVVSIKASEIAGELYDALKESGFPEHDLQRLIVRLVFCMFADHTGIFEPRGIFLDLLENRTSEDGSDTGMWLLRLFEVLNTPEEKRQSALDSELANFPYVNGELFRERLLTPDFNSVMRKKLLDACEFVWSEISPAIFGSLFQSVMDPDKRRAVGAHYTTEQNIMKVIGPLFLDDLRGEFARINRLRTRRTRRLMEFQDKLGKLKFLDPACGCGNFLVIAYRELRKLEIEVLSAARKSRQLDLYAQSLSKIDINQFYGIEVEEFPVRIAETALWMMDHIMNNELSRTFGLVYARIPLQTSAHILHADALEIDWNTLLPSSECSYVIGNPPYIGHKVQSDKQRKQIRRLFAGTGARSVLDYVCGWFIMAGRYIRSETQVGFVATNSISQGEQVGELWPVLFDHLKLEISFAHSTFAWSSEARGAAHVHVVILGLLRKENAPARKLFFRCTTPEGNAVASSVSAISPYLTEVLESLPYLTVKSIRQPANGMPVLIAGSKPIDDGHYIFRTASDRDEFIRIEPDAERYIRPYIGAKDVIQGRQRFILALQNASAKDLAKMPAVREKIRAVRAFRAGSKSKPTRQLALVPTQFHINVLPNSPFLVIPVTSSERREYIPICLFEPPVVPNIDTRILLNASLYEFGLLTSSMHMIWLRYVGGRLESRYRYSIGLVYNTFPVPMNEDKSVLDAPAQAILNERKKYEDTSLEQLYDPDFMPLGLRKAHAELDRQVEKLYRSRAFKSDRERIVRLFGLYERQIKPKTSGSGHIR